MALLAIRGPDVTLCFRKGRWVVLRRGVEVRQVRVHEVDEVQVHGPGEVAASARAAALARGVPLVFLTQDGRYRGRMEGPMGRSGALLLDQARWLVDEGRALALARAVVKGKIESERRILLAHQRSRPLKDVGEAACALRALIPRVDEADHADGVRGVEGRAAALYFGVFGRLLARSDMPWRGRSRRPPRDPPNACLSFGYTLLYSRAESALLTVGLHPGAGALPQASRGQPALALDLMEEFRAPVVDRLVLRLLNRRQLDPEDFEDPAWRRPAFPAGDDASVPDPDPFRANDGPGDLLPEGRADEATEAPEAEPDAAPPEPPDPPVGGRPGSPSVGAVYMGAHARRLFLRQFSEALRGDLTDADTGERVRLDWLLERQARRLARVFQGREAVYRPFRGG